MKTHDQSNSSACLVAINKINPAPKETKSTRLVKVMRRVQLLQEKLKSGQIIHGPDGDRAE